jgi:hypothetical protein
VAVGNLRPHSGQNRASAETCFLHISQNGMPTPFKR